MSPQNRNQIANNKENGAALITVVMIAALLSIATIAILSGVGSNSRNSTDVLNETKAYYAAESGLQASINVLRHHSPGVNYSEAIQYPNLEKSGWLPYNCDPTNATLRKVSIGPNPCDLNNGISYRIVVSDPDNSGAALRFSTVGAFLGTNVATVSYPNATDANRITLSWVNVTNCLVSFPSGNHCAPNDTSPNAVLSTLRIVQVGTGAAIPSPIRFSINYSILAPRTATRTIRGTISRATSTSPVTVTFDSPLYKLMDTDIRICASATTTNPCPAFTSSITLAAGNNERSYFMNTTAVEPYRLKVLSTGFGPNGARKQLEGIIQKNFFNDLSGPAAITMQGAGAGLVFNPGNSSQFAISGANGIPSVGVNNQTGLNTVNNGIPNNNNNIQPAPAVVTDLPDWMATPQALDAMVSQLRQAAQNSGRYFQNPTQNLSNVGNYSNGTGITFCEGDCTAGVDGGGILVVTGQLRNVGGFDFRGLIIVTGPEGWLRNGGGGGVISGNVVIAPYGAAQLASNTFSLPPKYDVTGGGNSTVEYDAVNLDNAFSGTASISNFMLGVAEK